MKKTSALSIVFFLLFAALAACSHNSSVDPSNANDAATTTVSGTIAISQAAAPTSYHGAGGPLAPPAAGTGAPLSEATVELYDADKPDWLYPVSVAQTDSAGFYQLSKLANADKNGNSYHDHNPIPSGNYTIIANKYDANIGKLYVAVQTVVKNFHGSVEGNDLVALDSGVEPIVQDIAGLPKNIDATFGSPATALPQNAAIQVTFNTAMARLTLLGAISIKDPSGSSLQGTWRVSTDLLSVTFSPAGPLNTGTVYTITVLGGADEHAALNLYGNPIPATATATFVSGEGDVLPPDIALFSPSGTENIPITTLIQIASDEILDVTALAVSSAPSIGDKPSVQFAGKTGIASRPYVYTIIPAAPLLLNTRYEFTISGIRDLAGNSATPFTFFFQTAPIQALPRLLVVTPSNGSVGVDVNTTISAVFSTDMDTSSLVSPATAFTMSGIAGTVAYDAAVKKAIFTPSAPLAPHTLYTATITTAAKDTTGTPLAQGYTWSFTTKSGSQQSGDLDRTAFGSAGTVVLPIGNISSFARAIAVQADGKIVAGGYSYVGSVPQFTLVRLNTNGALDAAFGDNGIVVTSFSSDSGSGIYSLAIQLDGKIVAVGNAPGGFGLARYDADGSLDTAFGAGGKMVTAVGQYPACYAVGLQSDGRIVAAGTAWNGVNHDIVVVRYTAGGVLDTSFNGTGKVMTDVAGGHDQAFALAVQGDGKIVVGGYADTAQGRNFGMLRYLADGALDPAFGTGGKVTTSFGSSQINALGIQADGKIVAAGYQETGNLWQVAMARYNADGTLDNSFDSDGLVTTAAGNWRSSALALTLQSDGKIVIAGYSGTLTLPTDMLLIRYNADGNLDALFGSGGVVLTDIGGGADSANAVAIQPDGNIVTAGEAFVGQRTDFALARYLAN